jgi:hypothetical protein
MIGGNASIPSSPFSDVRTVEPFSALARRHWPTRERLNVAKDFTPLAADREHADKGLDGARRST